MIMSYFWIHQKHKNVDILKKKNFSSNEINNLLYIKDYSMTKNSLLEDVKFNRLCVYIYTCGVSAKVVKQISKFCTYILLPY